LAKSRNLHLAISAIIITIISLSYGLFPDKILPWLFDFKVESNDLKQVFRSTMGLYLGMVILWVTGIFKPVLWRTATITNVFFMGSLSAGRVISLIIDGIPSIPFSVGLVVELILALWGIINLKKYREDLYQAGPGQDSVAFEKEI
jgi:hypothetical protein